MVEADAVLAQEGALSGTLRLWLALVSHAQAAPGHRQKPGGVIGQDPAEA